MLNENPLKLNIGEYTIHIPDAPSSGPVLALILNIVDGEQPGSVRSHAKESASGFSGSSQECPPPSTVLEPENSYDDKLNLHPSSAEAHKTSA